MRCSKRSSSKGTYVSSDNFKEVVDSEVKLRLYLGYQDFCLFQSRV